MRTRLIDTIITATILAACGAAHASDDILDRVERALAEAHAQTVRMPDRIVAIAPDGRVILVAEMPDDAFVAPDGRIVTSAEAERLRRVDRLSEALDPAKADQTRRLRTLAESLDRDDAREARKVVGVNVEAPSPALAAQLGVRRDAALVVTRSQPRHNADAASRLQRFDVITAVNGNDHVSLSTLRAAIQGTPEGGRVVMRVIRGGEPTLLTVPVFAAG